MDRPQGSGTRNRISESSRKTEVESSSCADAPETPEAIVGRFCLGRSPEFSTWGDTLRRAARTARDDDIVHVQSDVGERKQSYAQLLRRAEKVLGGLKLTGLAPGDTAILLLEDNSDVLAGFWGCVLCGVAPLVVGPPPVIAPGDRSLDQLRRVWQGLNRPSIIVSGTEPDETVELARMFSAAPSRLLSMRELLSSEPDSRHHIASADDTLFLTLTSGSTSTPKCVPLTHRNIWSRATGTNELCGHTAGDVILNWLPFDHIGSMSDWHLRCVLLGCQLIYVSKEHILAEPRRWLDLIDQYRVTHTWAPNFAYGLINDALRDESSANWDLSCVEAFLTAGEAVSSGSVERFLERLAPYGLKSTAIRPAFGMAEMGSGVTYRCASEHSPIKVIRAHRSSTDGSLAPAAPSDPDAVSFVSLGPPIPGIALRIMDSNGQVVPNETIGQLHVKGEAVSSGYYGAPDASAAFRSDGWFETGDLGFLSDGELYITGRVKDSIVINGANYYCGEIEDVLESVDGVEPSFSAACAVRDRDEGSEQLAVVFHCRCADDDELLELLKRIRQQLVTEIGIFPDYLVPLSKADVPKTAIGKVQRSRLSAKIEAGEFAGVIAHIDALFSRGVGQVPPRNETERRIAAIWREVLDVPSVGREDNIFELGGNSLLLVKLHDRLQRAFGVNLTVVDMFSYPTVATLADFLSRGATTGPAISTTRGRQRAESRRRSQSVDSAPAIAVIGLACRFPGATSANQFWQNLRDGVESIRELSEEEILAAGIDPALLHDPDYVRAGPVLDDVEQFDAEFFGYSQREAEIMDPQQRLLLECAWEAFEDAGYNPLGYKDSAGVFVGGVLNTYLLNHLFPSGAHLDGAASEVMTLSSLGGFQVMVANDKDYLPTRISYKLDLSGPSVNVQTACSSSLVAVHMAAQSILDGQCDLALAGGVSVSVPQTTGYLFQEGLLGSPDGHCRAFDAEAQGTVFGNGAGIVLLKRLDQALDDRDHIYAVVKGSAINNDGGQKAGYFAPSQDGQTAVTAEALQVARVDPKSVGLVEAHGTGTELGDPIEIAGLSQAFGGNNGQHQYCAIGSVKTNIGHMQIASGIAGFLKAVLAVQHGQLPPSLHFNTPNPRIDFEHSPFYVNTTLRPWPETRQPRRATVNSLGIGGTNAHVVLEQKPPATHAPAKVERPKHIFTLSAKTLPALRAQARRYTDALASRSDNDLPDICFTAGVGRAHFAHRMAVVGDSMGDVRDALRLVSLGKAAENAVHLSSASSSPPEIAFLFTGEAPQRHSQIQPLYETQPLFRASIERCDEILQSVHSGGIASLKADVPAGQPLRQETLSAHALAFSVEYALAELWISWGLTPATLIGHGLGRYAAAAIAGVMSLEDALRLVACRAELLQETRERDSQRPLSEQHLAKYKQIVSSIAFHTPKFEVVSSSTGLPFGDEIATPDYWSASLQPTTDPTEDIARIAWQRCNYLLEVGMRSRLLENAGDYLSEHQLNPESHQWSASLNAGDEAWDSMLRTLAALYVRGAEVDWSAFDRGYVRQRTSLPTYPFQRKRYWIERPRPRLGEPSGGRQTTEMETLRGGQILSPALDDGVCEATLNLQLLPSVDDHRFLGTAILPGAYQLAMIIEAGKTISADQDYSLADVIFSQAVVIPDDGDITLQVILSRTREKIDAFRVVGRRPDTRDADEDWTLHANGQLLAPPQGRPPERGQPSEAPTLRPGVAETAPATTDLDGHSTGAVAGGEAVAVDMSSAGREHLMKECRRTVSSDQFYQNMRDHGVELGPALRMIESAWVDEEKVLCRLNVPEDVVLDETFTLHPTLLDSCVQVMGGILEYSSDSVLVPVGAASFRQFDRADTQHLWCYTSVEASDLRSDGPLTTNTWLFQDDGRLLATFQGLRYEQVPRKKLDRLLSDHSSDLTYLPQWVNKSSLGSEKSPAGEDSGTWLIFSDSTGVGEDLVRQLQHRGQTCWVVEPGDKFHFDPTGHFQIDGANREHFHRLLEATAKVPPGKWRGIIHLWSLNESTSDECDVSDIMRPQRASCASVLHLVQAMDAAGWTMNRTLCVVTRQAQPVKVGGGAVDPAQAPLLGLARTIALEYPELRCLRVDLDTGVHSDQVEHLLMEIESSEPDGEIAYRGEGRYVRRLTSLKVDPAIQTSFRSDGTYLITGGTGGLGRVICDWLIAHGARHLVLVSRTGSAAPAIEEAIKRWRAAGIRVNAATADVSCYEEISAVLQQACPVTAPLCGVVHAAGILDDGVLRQQTWDRFEVVMASKVLGAWNLHRLTKDISLDFFVAFSSISSGLGSAGQGNYSAANAFLDSLMHYRRSSNLPGLAIDWGPWRGAGMAAAMPATHQQALLRRGLKPLEPSIALEFLSSLIEQASPQVMVADVDWARYVRATRDAATTEFVGELANTGQSTAENKGEFATRLRQASPDTRSSILLNHVRTLVAELLGIRDTKQLDSDRGFYELGLDSLSITTLRNRLQTALGLSLSATVAFTYSNIEMLSRHLEDRLFDSETPEMLDARRDRQSMPNDSQAEKETDWDQLSQEEIADRLARKLASIRSGHDQ